MQAYLGAVSFVMMLGKSCFARQSWQGWTCSDPVGCNRYWLMLHLVHQLRCQLRLTQAMISCYSGRPMSGMHGLWVICSAYMSVRSCQIFSSRRSLVRRESVTCHTVTNEESAMLWPVPVPVLIQGVLRVPQTLMLPVPLQIT